MAPANENIAPIKQEGTEAKQLRWTKVMDRFAIEFLFEEAKKGHKCDKSFKKSSFVQAAKAVAKNFNIDCTFENVENRMKTIKKKFKEVRNIEKNNSGMSWDDVSKMWQCSDDVYKAFVLAHPKAKPYLNKPIFMYDELCVVCGDDQATGSFAKSSTDDIIDIDEACEIGLEDVPSFNCTKPNIISLSSPPVRKHGKRVRFMDPLGEKFDKLAEAVVDVASAIKASSNSDERTKYLYSEVMKIEGFDELTLEGAFDYLNDNENISRSFLAKGMAGRYRWMKKFESESNF